MDPAFNASIANQSGTFTYRITDGDGDTAEAIQPITVENSTVPLVQTNTFTGVVEEEHLNSTQATGIDDATGNASDADTVGNLNVTTATTSGNLSTMVTGIDGTATYGFNVTDGTPATFVGGGNVQSQGGNVIYDVQGNTLWGFVNNGPASTTYDSVNDRAVFKIDLTPTTGEFTYTQLDNIDHHTIAGADNLEGIKAIDLSGKLTVTDSGDGGTINFNNVAVNVIDDIPVAKNDTASVIEGQGQDFNAVFVLDFSGSINNTELNTMLTAVKAAAQALDAGTSGDVIFRAVAFGSDSIAYGPFNSYASFAAQIDALNPATGGTRPINSSTDFTDAIQETMAVYTPLAGYSNQVFFLSDGNPNEQTGSSSNSLADATATAWNNFVDGSNINVTTIGIGDGINTARLQDVDLDGSGAPISVANFDDLIATLLNTVIGGDVSGNVILGSDNAVGGGNDDAFGADGGRIESITIGNVTYVWNGTNVIDPSGPDANIAGNQLTGITTPEGGKLTFNFATGAWSYTAPQGGVTSNTTETFTYTLIDGDGDHATANLDVTVIAANEAPQLSLNSAVSGNYRDEFSAASYNNSNGTTDWTPAAWTETSDSNGAAGGSIRIQNNELRLGEDGGNGATIERVVDLGGATSATLSFNFAAIETESGEAVVVSFAADGVNFVTLDTLDTNDADGAKSYALTGPFTANAVLRFSVNAFSNDSEWVAIDNVNIAYAGGSVPTYVEGGAPVAVMPAATLADPDNPANFNTGSLHVQLTAGATAGDQLVFTGALVTHSGGNVLVGGVQIGMVTGYGTADMTITLDTDATDARVESLMQAIAFSSSSDNPGTSRTVTVTFNDGGNTGGPGPLQDVETVTINVTATNDAPSITSDGAGATASVNVAENTTAVTDVNATDPDAGASLTYSILNTAGTDFGKFAINASTGVLTFIAAPNFEAPNDVGGTDNDNAYVVDVQVSDGLGGTDVQTITVHVTNANDAPSITSDGAGATASVNVAENTTAVTDVNAADPDAGASLTYSILNTAGTDFGKFAINASTGVLTFIAAPNFEAPNDVGAGGNNNSYVVDVQVSDGLGGTDVQTITVNVTNANEFTPVITSNGGNATASINVNENTTAVTTVTATDGDAGTTLTYFIVNTIGTDFSKFTINPSTGALTFIAAPNFEAPNDVGGTDNDNTYVVDVRVSDGTNTDTQTINVNVQNVVENAAPVANADRVLSNFGGSAFDVPEWAFLANDTDPDGDPLDITSVNGQSGLSATHNSGAGTITIDDDFASGGTFDYVASDGTTTSEGNVTYLQDNNSITGTAADEILVGDGDGDTFDGGG